MNDIKGIQPYSKAIVCLLKSTVERKHIVWNDIITYQAEIQNYISVIGLELIIKKDEGFAFLKQITLDDGSTLNLVSRRAVGFEVTTVLMLLRQILEDFDSNPSVAQSFEKFITGSEIRYEAALFLPEKPDYVKLLKDLDSYIKKVVDLGFLHETKRSENDVCYKIHRSLREKITFDDLQVFKSKLQKHVISE